MKVFKRSHRLLAAFIFLSSHIVAQQTELKKLVERTRLAKTQFEKIHLLHYLAKKNVAGKGSYHELLLSKPALDSILQTKPLAIELDIPIGGNQSIEAELVKQNIGTPVTKENNAIYRTDITKPVVYRGTIKNSLDKSAVALTLNNDFISVFISFNDKNISIEKEIKPNSEKVFVHNTSEINLPSAPFNCGTAESPASFQQPPIVNTHRVTASQDKCVYVFIECFDSLYQWRNSNYQQTIDYVYALFNNVATGFQNEQVNVKISTINVWTTQDPYRGDTRENAMADIAAYYQDDYWGNICVGLDYSLNSSVGRSGISGQFNGRVKGEAPNNCPSYTIASHSFIYADMNYNVNVQNFPTGTNVTQQQVYLTMHEMGHLLGSPHTHWCGWQLTSNPDTFGAIDNCAATEGGCAPGPAPVNGGFIMSYCTFTGTFINFSKGFGTLSGNAVRNFIVNSNCLVNCPACPSTVNIGNLPAGLNRFEVSNTIFANGIVPSGSYSVFDAGVKSTLSPGFRANNGANLKVIVNGCGGIR